MPISGRVNTSSMASMARRMSVAFFFDDAVRRREDQVDRRLGERDDVLRIAAPVGVGALDGDLALDDLASRGGCGARAARSERIPIVTLSKSMRRAALGAWGTVRAARGPTAWGPRCTGMTGPRKGACRDGRGFIRCEGVSCELERASARRASALSPRDGLGRSRRQCANARFACDRRIPRCYGRRMRPAASRQPAAPFTRTDSPRRRGNTDVANASNRAARVVARSFTSRAIRTGPAG